jgi:hypothetical protein
VYLGEIRSVIESGRRRGGYDFNVCGEPSNIVEVERDEVTLRFSEAKDFLYEGVDTPGVAAWRWATTWTRDAWHRVFGAPGPKTQSIDEPRKLAAARPAVCARVPAAEGGAVPAS